MDLNHTKNSLNASSHPLASRPDCKAKDSSEKRGNASSSGTAGSKRKFKANAFYNDIDAMSAKRMKRASMREATDGMKSTNPSPMAIPILRQKTLPPDRLRPAAESPNSADLAPDEAKESNLTDPLPPTGCETTECLLDEDMNEATGLTELLRLGNFCAKLLDSECVSEQLSKSYGEDSLRFTCMNGHNFFLAVSSVKETFSRLAPFNGRDVPPELLASSKWCNKCAKFFAKVRSMSSRHHCDVTGGLHQKRIGLRCRNSGHDFTISYSKKFEQISCQQCRMVEKDELRERLRREEALRDE